MREIGVAIRINPGSTQQHVGILYASEAGEIRICHLVTHLQLVDEVPDDTFMWVQAGIGKENRAVVNAILQNVIKRAPRIRYGLRYDGDYFTPTGDYLRRGLGNGLTCATFIMAIYRAGGFELLKVEEWPSGRPGDLDFQAAQVAWLQRHFPDFIEDETKLHIGDPRYRPDEVAGAVASNRIPLRFSEADKAAREITTALKRRRLNRSSR